MITAIALIISGITSCVCIIITISAQLSANEMQHYYDLMTKERDRLNGRNTDLSFRLRCAEQTLEKVRELVAPPESEAADD